MAAEVKHRARGRNYVGLALPTLSTTTLRLSQFVVLVLLSRLGDAATRGFMIAALGTLTAFTILSDSGAANFILARRSGLVPRNLYKIAIGTQLALTALGAVVAMAIILWRSPPGVSTWNWLILGSLCASQTLDSSLRAVRSPILLAGEDVKFSLAEFELAGLKLAVMAVVLTTQTLRWLVILPFLSVTVLTVTFVGVLACCSPPLDSDRGQIRGILRFGLAGSMSALYSQMPLAVASVVLPLGDTAMLTVAYRVFQPLEILPGTLATQLLPRVDQIVRRPFKWWLWFCGIGAVMSVLLLSVGVPLVKEGLQVSNWNTLVFTLVGIALIPKSGNYVLASILMGRGGITARMNVTAFVAIVGIVASIVAARIVGIQGLSGVSVLCEILLACGLSRAINRTVAIKDSQ